MSFKNILGETLRYTGKVTDASLGPFYDGFDQNKKYRTATVHIPSTEEDHMRLKLYIEGKDAPETGETINLEMVKSLGIPSQVNYIETTKGNLKVVDFDLLPV